MPLSRQSALMQAATSRTKQSQSRVKRFVRAIADARMRAYMTAVTDPATGRIDPDLERSVLRSMVF